MKNGNISLFHFFNSAFQALRPQQQTFDAEVTITFTLSQGKCYCDFSPGYQYREEKKHCAPAPHRSTFFKKLS